MTVPRHKMLAFLGATLTSALVLFASPLLFAGGMLEVVELISHPEQYDRQMVVVIGRVTNFQIGASQQGQVGYGFLLKDNAGTVKVVGLGKAEVHEGEQVIVEGVFNRLRQVGRRIIYNEIKATSIKPLERLNPDLVG